MKLILMGTGPFAVPSFQALHQDGHEICLVVVRPVVATKSRKGPPPAPVLDWAKKIGLAIYDPASINDDDAIEVLQRHAADLLVVCDYGQILKPSALETASLGGINLHGSLLPAYRGAAPVQWAMINGDKQTGVSVIHMTPKLDGGPILCTRVTDILDGEDAGELEVRLSDIGIQATREAIEMLGQWDGCAALGDTQDASLVSKAPRLKKSDGEIDWGRSAREIDSHVRGMSPWPLAFTFFQAKSNKPPTRLAVKSIVVLGAGSDGFASGEIVHRPDDPEHPFTVSTGDKLVAINRIQPAGKREMNGLEFFRGYQPSPGSRLFSP